jgi:glycosyltransferase involved in cell wall biosynthesis
MTSPDVSIVLNLHREASYLSRTAESLIEAVCFSIRSGLTFEAVIVLDRPDEATVEAAGLVARRMERHMAVQVVHVDNGSLGPSRTHGIRQARGRYIALADGDDLISFNFFDACFNAAQKNDSKCIVIPQYLMAFGATAHVWKYHDSTNVSPLILVNENAFLSRIFVAREVFEDLAYVDATGGRRAYEDWHFNVTALARGYSFICAIDAVLYYRQRPGSIMATTRDKLIPWTEFFRPDVFVALCGPSYRAVGERPAGQAEPWEGIRTQVSRSSMLLELTRAANRIDPSIDFSLLDYVVAGSNINGDASLGAAYYEACLQVGPACYSDVLLVPDLNAGGAEKQIISVLKVLAADTPSFKLLVLSGEPSQRHEWIDQLPDGSDFIDLHEIASRWGRPASTAILALRLIQSTAQTARIHLKPSIFANNFVSEFASEVPDCKFAFYYFCEDVLTRRGVRFSAGANFNFLSENGQYLDYLVADHEAFLDHNRTRLPLPAATSRAIYPAIRQDQEGPLPHVPKKLLWASRLHPQKRPALLPLIARKLQELDPAWQVDVFGNGPAEAELRAAIAGLKGIRLMGPYNGFDSLPRDYAAFVYTAVYDGLPNVILEAMAAGMPVLAPRIGGIPEVLSDGAGILLDDVVDDDEMATSYVNALVLLDRGGARQGILDRSAARQKDRHTQERFARDVLDLFGETVR